MQKTHCNTLAWFYYCKNTNLYYNLQIMFIRIDFTLYYNSVIYLISVQSTFKFLYCYLKKKNHISSVFASFGCVLFGSRCL